MIQNVVVIWNALALELVIPKDAGDGVDVSEDDLKHVLLVIFGSNMKDLTGKNIAHFLKF